jgi:hypothetical protein
MLDKSSKPTVICIREKQQVTLGCIIKNTETAKEINIGPVLDKIQKHIRNCLQHMNRMPLNVLPRILKYCIPAGRGTREVDYDHLNSDSM